VLLAIDIGNTNITMGMFEGDDLKVTWRVSTGVHRMPDEYGIMLMDLLRLQRVDPADITEGAISCVVPPLLTIFNEMFQKYFRIQPLVVGPGVKTGIRIRIDDPKGAGADLIANAAGAIALYEKPIIVVGLGTATAIICVSREGDYLGGAIAPGIGIAAEALYTRTAALPRVDLVRPRRAIGNNTLAAMQSGIVFGYAGLVEGLVRRIQDELGEKATVVATGGHARIVAAETKIIDAVNPHLTLIGIKTIHNLNRE
jgi:type III pantothenate kinase